MVECFGSGGEYYESSDDDPLADFRSSLPRQFQPEYQEDYDDLLEERESYLCPLDRKILEPERDAIESLDLTIRYQCSNLRKASGTEFFYYCGSVVDRMVGRGNDELYSIEHSRRDFDSLSTICSNENACNTCPNK